MPEGADTSEWLAPGEPESGGKAKTPSNGERDERPSAAVEAARRGAEERATAEILALEEDLERERKKAANSLREVERRLEEAESRATEGETTEALRREIERLEGETEDRGRTAVQEARREAEQRVRSELAEGARNDVEVTAEIERRVRSLAGRQTHCHHS